MEIRIIQIGTEEPVRLAAQELRKYLPRVDQSVETAVLLGKGPLEGLRGIRIGLLGRLEQEPPVPFSELDDEILIQVDGGEGVITGSNPRSVLFAAYRFLYEAGCRWVRPGKTGEKILPGKVGELCVSIREKAAYRHRGVCIEGSCSYRHVMDMIEWLPKLGMNAYFHQFFVPYGFFAHWYDHSDNPTMEAQPVSVEEVSAMVDSTVAALKERGLLLHRVGHGWPCETLGLPAHGWEKGEYHLSPEQARLTALTDGKRGIWRDVPLNTNLCYSSAEVRAAMAEKVVAYLKAHPQVDYLHIWLADEANNQCECEECRGSRPSEFYVQLLNEIDERLTAEGIRTKLVFLVYLDLLWAPVRERLKNKDRFVLMFAPICRSYTYTFSDAASGQKGEVKPFVHNGNEMPTKLEDNIAYLKEWQSVFSGDSFDFDYHMLWDWNFDLGGYRSAEVLFEDMRDMHALGLDGMVSCQTQRVAFPTSLGMAAMASALWGREQCFDQMADRYFSDLFGSDAGEMKEYLSHVSRLLHPPYLRLEESQVNDRRADTYDELYQYVRMKAEWFQKKESSATEGCDCVTWRILSRHGEVCGMLAQVLESRARGRQEEAMRRWGELVSFANSLERELHSFWDVQSFVDVVGKAVRGKNRPGIDH